VVRIFKNEQFNKRTIEQIKGIKTMKLKTNKYKQTEVGLIPEDWEVKTLGEISKLKNGYAFSSDLFSKAGPIVITPGNFKLEGGLKFNEKNTLRYSGFVSKDMQFKNGDLLIVMTDLTPDCNLLGKPGFVNSEEVILHNQRIGKIIITSNIINQEYLYWFFVSELFSKRMKETATGSTVRHTSVGSINSSLIPIPPTLAEQTAISTALSDADALINSLEKLIAKKRLIKQAAMQKLLQPKKDWVVKKLGEIAEIYTGKKNNQDKVENGEYPFFVRSQTVERINTYSFDGEAILVPGEGNIGKIFHYINGKFDFHQRVYKISDFKPGYIGKYIYHYISENFGKHALENSVKATVDSLRLPTFQVFEIPFPPTEGEQSHIATILSDMDNEIQVLETKLEKYRKIKLGMMQNLLTGKIRLV
jgi:type I restriction enzyme, S subunit